MASRRVRRPVPFSEESEEDENSVLGESCDEAGGAKPELVRSTCLFIFSISR